MTVNSLVGVLVTIALALSSFALNEIYDMNAQIALLEEEVKHEQKVTRSLRMHWKLHRWAHDEINVLRNIQKLEGARWPEFDRQ